MDKINGNQVNDAKVEKLLKKDGWKIIHIWGCELKKDKIDKTLNRLKNRLEKLRDAV